MRLTRPLLWRGILWVYLILALCPIRYCAPTGADADNTWFFALNYAAAHHLVIGRDIAWTWGPLSHLLVPFDIGNNLAKGLAFQGALWILLALILSDVFFRDDVPLRNLAAFSILISFSTLDYSQAVYPGDLLLLSAMVLLLFAGLRGGAGRYVAALVMVGLTPLTQFFGGMIAAAAVAGLIIHRLLRKAWRDAALAAIVPALVAIVSCRWALGSLRAIAGYVKCGFEFARNYSVIMSLSGPRIELVAGLEAILLVAVLLLVLMRRNRDKACFFGLVLALPLLMSFRHGFVRQDAPHITGFFSFVAVALGLMVLAVPLDEQFTKIGTAVVLVSFAFLWQDYIASKNLRTAIASLTGRRTLSLVWKAIRLNHLRAVLAAEGRQNYPVEARVEPEIKSIVANEPVGFLSNVYSNAVMDNINLVLSPVLQRYAVSTTYLDHLNAAWLDEHGPRFLIFDGKTIDGRQPWAESPATWSEVYRWYDTRLLAAHNLLLERRRAPRFKDFSAVAQDTMHFGEQVKVPASAEPLFWTMRCLLNPTGKLRALLLRVPMVSMDVDEADRRAGSFRALLPMLGEPSLGNYLPSNLSEFAEVFRESRDPDFSVAGLAFEQTGKPAYEPGCEVEFLRAAK